MRPEPQTNAVVCQRTPYHPYHPPGLVSVQTARAAFTISSHSARPTSFTTSSHTSFLLVDSESSVSSASLLEDHPVVVGLALRVLLALALPYLLDDGRLLRGVRYTDVDYDVFADAARHVAGGRSPYARHTYRYTPFLARLLAVPLARPRVGAVLSPRHFGKLLFYLADVLCGALIAALRRRTRATSRARGDAGGGRARCLRPCRTPCGGSTTPC